MPNTVPQRTCVGCRKKKSKQDLIRIIIGEESSLLIDKTGKKGSRGTYLCKPKTKDLKLKANNKCLEMAIEKQAFQQAFRKKIDINSLWQNRQKKFQKNKTFKPALR